MIRLPRRLFGAVLLSLLALPLSAQQDLRAEALRVKIDSVFAEYDSRDSPGCAVAVVQDGRTVFSMGYGTASLEHDAPITPQTAFYAASVSKQFTAFAVALLAVQGKLSLDDDIRRWIPEVPDFGPTITVRHLIHHTSGLRDYFGLLGLTGWRGDGPLTEGEFLHLVGRQRALNFRPGTQFLYNNTGYVLLAILVERVTGKSLREFSEAAIFHPLEMTRSQFRDDHTMLVEKRALGYAPGREGSYRLSMPGFDVVGDGGLYTTVEDLARWAQNLDRRLVGGPEVSELILTRGRLENGEEIAYAFGLVHGEYRGLPVVQHGGSYGGYRTHMLYVPQRRTAVATLRNPATASPAALGQRVVDITLGDALQPRPEGDAHRGSSSKAEVPPEQLARYAGAYWNERLQALRRVAVSTGKLAVFIGGEWLPLNPVAPDRFQPAAGGATFRFAAGPDGLLHMEEARGAGELIVFQQMPAPQQGRESPGDYAGAYRSEELDVTWRLKATEGKLLLGRPGMQAQLLDPAFPDTFAFSGGVLRFERDPDGRVVGFVLSAGRVAGLRFGSVSVP